MDYIETQYFHRQDDKKNLQYEEYFNEFIPTIKAEVENLTRKEKIDLLLQSIRCLDLTRIQPNDSIENVRNLCLKAANPMKEIQHQIKEPLKVAAICVHHTNVKDAVNIFQEENITGIKIASVAADFPSGQLPLKDRLQEIHEAVEAGADEIDIVIDRNLVEATNWKGLEDELKQMKKACGKATMKTILSTGELGSAWKIYRASIAAINAGSNFIKTSTGKEVVNATLEAGIVMCDAISEMYEDGNYKTGLKPAGGIKTAEEVLQWMILVRKKMNSDPKFLTPELFRIGASSVLDDIVKTYKSLVDEESSIKDD